MNGGGLDVPHLPRQAPIDAYGNGGFRFAGMSHRGSLLCLPAGIWPWPVASLQDLNEALLQPIFAQAAALDFFLLGVGAVPAALPPPWRERFRAAGLVVDVMPTGAAVRTYNILVAEDRRFGAGLIAV